MFGHINVSRAFLPQFRLQREGTLAFVSSEAGIVGYEKYGLYCATKFALEGFAESLSKEVKQFALGVCLLEYVRKSITSSAP